uniref:Uncharacterized protein AlNc14C95G5833 n=1 Tax=Albugo laibachii Nc14 TaxID=890382 RepID=F0WGV7_9STRA|nr:conserved hypothetical protein [Albugo laibachii Nc14]|eukprot:CCA20472.1 conserved hypothetical protein [Albugo laibachii Nc14]
MQVFGRAVTPSSAVHGQVCQFLRQKQRDWVLFDLCYVLMLLKKTMEENQLAIQLITQALRCQRLKSHVIEQAFSIITQSECWFWILPSMIPFANVLISLALQPRITVTTAQKIIETATWCHFHLIHSDSSVQDEALKLMLSVLSQPHKLILEATLPSRSTREDLCWYTMECMASQLLRLAQEGTQTLIKSASLIVNHFEMIMEWTASDSMAPTQSEEIRLSLSYPNHILEIICAAIVFLTKKDSVMYAFVISTFQKQLFSLHRIKKTSERTTRKDQSSRESSKPFVIVLLAGYLLNDAGMEARDQSFVLHWMQTLLMVLPPDSQNLQWILRFLTMYVRNGKSQASDVKETLLSQILPKMDFRWRQYDPVRDKDNEILYLSPASDSNNREVLILELGNFVLRSLDQLQTPLQLSKFKQTSPLYVHIDLLKTLFYCFVTCTALESRETGVPYQDVAVVLPSLIHSNYESPETPKKRSDAIQSMCEAICCTLCSVHLLVDAINVLARCGDDVACQSFSTKLETCFTLSKKIDTALHQVDEAVQRLDMTPSLVSPSLESEPNLQIASSRLKIIYSHLSSMQSTSNSFTVSMYDLELKSVLCVFDNMNLAASSTLENPLLDILMHCLKAPDPKNRNRDCDSVSVSSLLPLIETIMEHLPAVAYLGSRTITLFEELGTSSEAAQTLELVYLVLCRMLLSTTRIDATKTAADSLLGEYTDILVVGIADGVATALGFAKGTDVPLLACCEFLSRAWQVQAFKLKDPFLVCKAIDLLCLLAGDASYKQQELAAFGWSLLHQPYPFYNHEKANSELCGRFQLLSSPIFQFVPSVADIVGGCHCDLQTYLCSPTYAYIAHMLITAWTLHPFTNVLMQVNHAMGALLSHFKGKAQPERKRPRKKQSLVEEVVVDGEHRILKNLGVNSFPVFLESTWLCGIASLAIAQPQFGRESPYELYLSAAKCLQTTIGVFNQTEACGLVLQVKINMRFLQGSLVVLRCVKSSLLSCLEWREQLEQNCKEGDLAFLNELVADFEHIVAAIRDMVYLNFQERMALNTLKPSKRRADRGWHNDLMAVTYGKKYARRRSLSRKEAQILPYVTYEIEQIREFLTEKCRVYDLQPERSKCVQTSSYIVPPSLAIDSVLETLCVLWSGEVTEEEMLFLEAQWRVADDNAGDDERRVPEISGFRSEYFDEGR